MISLFGVSYLFLPLNEKALDFSRALKYLAPRPGLEPGTYGLTVRRSTD
jgi:hypothetical protein